MEKATLIKGIGNDFRYKQIVFRENELVDHDAGAGTIPGCYRVYNQKPYIILAGIACPNGSLNQANIASEVNAVDNSGSYTLEFNILTHPANNNLLALLTGSIANAMNIRHIDQSHFIENESWIQITNGAAMNVLFIAEYCNLT